MTQETPVERKRRLARERQQRMRDARTVKRKAMGASKFKMEMYSGTSAALETVRTAGEFDDAAEALTLLIHAAAKLAKRDPMAFRELVEVRRK